MFDRGSRARAAWRRYEMKRDEEAKNGEDGEIEDHEPEGKPVTGLLLGIAGMFLLVISLQIFQRC